MRFIIIGLIGMSIASFYGVFYLIMNSFTDQWWGLPTVFLIIVALFLLNGGLWDAFINDIDEVKDEVL